MSSQKITIGSHNISLNPSRGFVGGAINYYKHNAASCLGVFAVATPFIIGSLFLSEEAFKRAWNNPDITDYNIYHKLNGYFIASAINVSFNVITSIACNIIKNSKTYYNRIKQKSYNFLPVDHNDTYNNRLKQPYRYVTCIQALKNTLKTTTISVLTGIAAQAFNDLTGYRVLPSIPIAALSSIISNIILSRKSKKE